MTNEPQVSIKDTGPLAAFAYPGFGYLFSSTVLFAFAMSLEQLAVGWLVLDETGSAFLTGVAFAVRMGPNLIFGPISGALADRHARSQVMASAGVIKAAVLALMFALVSIDSGAIAVLLFLVGLGGISMSLRTSAYGAIIPDVVGQTNALSATSIGNLGQRGIGIAGGLTAGFIIAGVSPAAVFILASVIALVAGVGYTRVRSLAPPQSSGRRVWTEVRDGLGLILTVPIVTMLLGLMIIVEILGFSYMSLLPVLAEDVLDVGPEGLGALTSAAAAGSLIGMAGLAMLGDYRRKGALLLAVVFGFGIFLILLGASDIFAISLLVVGGVGVATAMVDTLEWVLLQSSVPRDLRGRALGAWSATTGMGWVGPLVLGAIATIWGVQAALAAFGIGLAATAIVATLTLPRLRQG